MEQTTFEIRQKWMVHNALLALLASSAEIKDGPILYVQAVVVNVIVAAMIGYFMALRLESITKPTRQRFETQLRIAIDTIRNAFSR